MKELIAKLEKATEPSDDLDQAIYIALGAKPPTLDVPLYWTTPDGSTRHYESMIPRYTGSYDAALKLVPEGWMWALHGGDGCHPGAQLEKVDDESRDGEIIVEAATTIIALCICGLKARALSAAGQRQEGGG